MLYDTVLECNYMGKLGFLLPHEVLDALIPEGSEVSDLAFPPEDFGLETELVDWCGRVGVSRSDGPWACISIWGDDGAFSEDDSLILFSWSLLNGEKRNNK